MGVCACGRNTNDTQCERCTALGLFGLAQNATPAEIKDAYRTLAKVWHPDRFPGDEHLRQKAEEKLKEINSAYQVLTAKVEDIPYRSARRPAPSEEPRPTASAATGPTPFQRPANRSSFAAKRNVRAKRRLAFLVLLIAAATWVASRYGRQVVSELEITAKEVLSGADRTTPATHAAQTAVSPGSGHGSGQANSTQMQPSNERLAEKTKSNARPKPATPDRASLLLYPTDDPRVAYFTVGSSKNDVLQVQGQPSRTTSDVFIYGRSEVFFRNGRVESWHTDPGSPLRAQMP